MSEESTRIVGIDLGTTYSCICYLDETGRPVVCPSAENENTTPSVVRMNPNPDEVVAGRAAKDTAISFTDNTIQFVKSKIGKVENLEYSVDGETQTTTPADVSAEILKKVVRDASSYTNSNINLAVITVPAYFGVREKEETKLAGQKAGLTVVDIVEEPTAAAFYYGMNNLDSNEVICIYDLGGGTFDVTAMELQNGNLTVLTTDGDHDLGGKNWDSELIDMVKEKFEAETDYDEEYDVDTEQELIIKCENAKKLLSSANEASVAISIDRAHKANIKITREEFNERTAHLLNESIRLTKEVFKRVEESGKTISKILLVGGSTYMPQVMDALASEFSLPIERNEPNEAVATGACLYNACKIANAVQGASAGEEVDSNEIFADPAAEGTDEGFALPGTTITKDEDGTVFVGGFALPPMKNIQIKTVATKSYGIYVLVGGQPKIRNLILKDTVLPFEYTASFGTSVDNQTSVQLELFQSQIYEEVYDTDKGFKIADSILEGIPAGKPAGADVTLTIRLEENGLITITGKHESMDLVGKLELSYGEGVESN